MEHRTQSDLSNAIMSSTGQIFNTPLGYLFGWGPTVPADATAGWSIGAIFIHTDGAAGSAVYINEGTLASSDFDPIGSL